MLDTILEDFLIGSWTHVQYNILDPNSWFDTKLLKILIIYKIYAKIKIKQCCKFHPLIIYTWTSNNLNHLIQVIYLYSESKYLFLPHQIETSNNNMQPKTVPPDVAQNWWGWPSKRAMWIFMPNNPTTTIPALTIIIIVLNIIDTCSSWFRLSSNIILM